MKLILSDKLLIFNNKRFIAFSIWTRFYKFDPSEQIPCLHLCQVTRVRDAETEWWCINITLQNLMIISSIWFWRCNNESNVQHFHIFYNMPNYPTSGTETSVGNVCVDTFRYWEGNDILLYIVTYLPHALSGHCPLYTASPSPLHLAASPDFHQVV